MSSDTPRTNAHSGWGVTYRGRTASTELYVDSTGPFVHAQFARQLERELNAAKKRIKRLEDIIDRAANRFFSDGPDGQTAAEMLKILEEVREPRP